MFISTASAIAVILVIVNSGREALTVCGFGYTCITRDVSLLCIQDQVSCSAVSYVLLNCQ